MKGEFLKWKKWKVDSAFLSILYKKKVDGVWIIEHVIITWKETKKIEIIMELKEFSRM